ncbi:ornithine cyclodeaminase [Histomonas meleagridis]|uniref:ornithine cyclodeaminase n=1 Tax=Histomonas meleagridis TaxID=135588 RepID=UPI003559B140|nr:ornithine cyclodeaminase [Histomonas meleagridis]KAH0806798.1 ornithine cyclodeaminase [Histomonas meleagridis]
MRVLNGKQIEEVYTHELAIQDCLRSYSVIADNKMILPIRTTTKTENQDLLLMPAAVKNGEKSDLGVKILSLVPGNRDRGLPFILGKVLTIDEETGAMEALLDGSMVTYLRTGATAGASARLFHPKPAENVVIFGCGAQGRAGFESILHAHPEVKHVSCFDYFPAAAKKYAETYSAKYPNITFTDADDKEKAVRNADIIHCATTSQEALFDGTWVKPGAHISAIGAYRLDMHELPTNIFSRSDVRLFIDEKEACESEAGDVMKAVNEGVISWEKIHLWGDVVNGKIPGRENDEQVTIIKVVGIAVQDIVAAKTIVKVATEKNVGVVVDI